MVDYKLLSRLDLKVFTQLRRDIRDAVLAEKPLIVLDTEETRTVCAALYHTDAAVTPTQKQGGFDMLLDSRQLEEWKADNIHWGMPQGCNTRLDVQQTFVVRIPPVTANADAQTALLMAQLRTFVDRMERIPWPSATVFVLYGNISGLPEDLYRAAEIIDVAYPAMDDLRLLTRTVLEEAGISAEADRVEALAKAMSGLTCEEVLGMLGRILNADPENGRAAIDSPERCQAMIRKKKSEVLKRGELLELIPPRAAELGNMHSVRKWIDARTRFIRDEHGDARFIGPAIPMGMMLTGVPGCGKSETAAYLAEKWNLPLIRMDYGRLMGGLVGESERKLRRALNQAEVMECILWIDEMEKSVGNANQGSGDGGTSQRMQATLLTWMQERRDKNIRCFIYATANSLRGIAKEMMRYGRIDELFSVMLPTHSGCRGILRVLMRGAERKARAARVAAGEADGGRYVMFEADCYGSVLDAFISGGAPAMPCVSLAYPGGSKRKELPMFVSGTDLLKVFDLARMHYARQENAVYPITGQKWLGALQQALRENELSVTSTGAGSMDEIAIDYIRMLRGKFILADSDRDVEKEHPYDVQSIFRQSDYTVAEEERKVSLKQLEALNWAYDKLLYDDLAERIIRLGSRFEKNADARLTTGM